MLFWCPRGGLLGGGSGKRSGALQSCPKTAPRLPKLAPRLFQDGSKIAAKPSQGASRWNQDCPQGSFVLHFLSIQCQITFCIHFPSILGSKYPFSARQSDPPRPHFRTNLSFHRFPMELKCKTKLPKPLKLQRRWQLF